jgi:hypothetical protein
MVAINPFDLNSALPLAKTAEDRIAEPASRSFRLSANR